MRFVRGDFNRADPERGRFRDYLKTSLRRLVTDHYRERLLGGVDELLAAGGRRRCQPLGVVAPGSGGPALVYPVSFSRTATYHVWVRGQAAGMGDNSVHVLLDEQSLTLELPDAGAWSWSNTAIGTGSPATLNVGAPGVRRLEVKMHEAGFLVDKIVLTTDPSFLPLGVGPAASPRDLVSGNREPPVIDAFIDNVGLVGAEFMIQGEGFTGPGLTVRVCGVHVTPRLLEDLTTLVILAPECGPGPARVEVCTDFGCAVDDAGFTYIDEVFARGAINGDDSVDLSDAIAVLLYLFAGRQSIPCLDAADVDDSGAVNVTDPVFLLNYLFRDGPAPHTPFPSCARDPTPDTLDCSDSPHGCT